jgi:hypothetical protein
MNSLNKTPPTTHHLQHTTHNTHRSLLASSAELNVFLQVNEFEDDETREDLAEAVKDLQAKLYDVVALIKESQADYLSHTPLEVDCNPLQGFLNANPGLK